MRAKLFMLLLISGCHCKPAACQEIMWPTVPVIVQPDELLVARPVEAVAVGEFITIGSSERHIVRIFPDGLVRVTYATGPVLVPSCGPDGEVVLTEHKSPHIYFLSPVKPGVVCIDLIPVGVVLETAIERHVLTVVDGTKPNPPPDPGPKPEPKPDPQPVAKNVSVAIIEDTMNRSPDTAILMNGLVAWAGFVDSGNDWRAYDLTTSELKGQKAIVDLNGSSPGVVIYDKVNGKMIHRGTLPRTLADLKTLIKGLTGG